MKYYIAYGSNLSVKQMAYRCPSAKIVGKAMLKDWLLVFGAHASIEPCEGAEVPVLIWSIEDSDEKSLDRYEGYPKYYYKDYVLVDMTDLDGNNPETVAAMVYIMTDIQKTGQPTWDYYHTIRSAYKVFGFDIKLLKDALWRCMERNWPGEEEQTYGLYEPIL